MDACVSDWPAPSPVEAKANAGLNVGVVAASASVGGLWLPFPGGLGLGFVFITGVKLIIINHQVRLWAAHNNTISNSYSSSIQ